MTFAQPFQDYEILDRVGAGAMGTVFKARHKRLNRIVALKVLKPSLARDSRYVDRLRREARIVASLNHPYIVSGYDLGEEGGYHYFVMEFVEGKSLRGLLLEWGMFAEEYVRRVARQTAMALDHAYQRGVIHRDIKPGNILIDEAGNVKLTDMGLAKGPADLTLTRDGATVGTPQYISPEQARNPHDVDVRTDLYSLGATLYHMAAGVPPYRGDTMAELITNVLGAVPTPPNEINPALSEGLSLVIRKLLVKDVSVRYQTPQELLEDLDRIDRSQPPKVDSARLLSGSSEASPWFGRVLLTLAVLLLLGVAWRVGVESHTPVEAGQVKEQFLEALDGELAALPTPGARLRRMDAVTTAPAGTEAELAQRRRQVASELDSAVQVLVEQALGSGWKDLKAWLRDPLEWPDRARFDSEWLAPRLRDQVGVALGKFPVPERLKEFGRTVDRALVERDTELVARFDLFVATTLPARADALRRANDFAGARRLWREGMALFFESVRLQPPERLPRDVQQRLEERRRQAEQDGLYAIDVAEQKVEQALLGESSAVVELCRERLRGGAPPDQVRVTLRDYRRELEQMWPAADKFQADRNPWPGIERLLGTLQAEIALAENGALEASIERRFDLAWRAICRGQGSDALAVLTEVVTATPMQQAQLLRHRAALEAAHLIERAVLAAVANAKTPPVAFLRGGGGAIFDLRVEPQGNELCLVAQATGQPPRQARLTEFRFSDLCKRLQDAGLNPFRGVPPAIEPLGLLVLRLIGDDLTGMAEQMQRLDADDRAFFVDQISPRILRVREERPEPAFDRESLLADMIAAWAAASSGSGSLTNLERAIIAFRSAVAEEQRNSRENVELRAASAWLELAKRRHRVATELNRAAPRGADVDVRIVDNALEAEVGIGANVLQSNATDGWQLGSGGLQYAGAGRPWSDLQASMLQAQPGIEQTAMHTRLQIDFVLPPASIGCRFYLIEFRGISCALVVAGNDGVYAALVDNDARREENAQRAFERALAGVLPGRPKAIAIPGAVHRLTMDVKATAQRTRAQVHVAFEGIELCAGWPELSPQQPPNCVLYPQQEIAVVRIGVTALGL